MLKFVTVRDKCDAIHSGIYGMMDTRIFATLFVCLEVLCKHLNYRKYTLCIVAMCYSIFVSMHKSKNSCGDTAMTHVTLPDIILCNSELIRMFVIFFFKN